MKIFSDFGNGFINCFKAFSILFERGLWHYIFYPILIWAGIWIASIYGFVALADYLTELVKPYLSLESISNEGSWLYFLKPKLTGAFSFIVSWLLKIIFWFVGSIFSKYLLLMILSPLFSLLSESADEKLTGNKFPFNIIQLLKDVLRGITVNLRNLFMELFLTFALWLITFFFPPLIFITFPLGLVIGWYFIGFNLLDYSCERHKLSVREGIQFIKRNRGYAIGVGCVYSLFMSLPTFAGDLVGLMFGPTLAVIGATMSFLEIKKKELNPS
jgi:CysZ protein